MNSDITTFLLGIITVLLGAIGYFVKRIFDATDRLKNDMKPITPAIVEIQGKFADAGHQILFPLTVAPGSPLHVTEYGDKLLRESGFYEVLKENQAELVKLVKDRKPGTNYDIQRYATEVIQDLLDSNDEMSICLKDYAFNNGLKLSILAAPAGIALRDEVMKELKF
jgi:hypothetical protein